MFLLQSKALYVGVHLFPSRLLLGSSFCLCSTTPRNLVSTSGLVPDEVKPQNLENSVDPGNGCNTLGLQTNEAMHRTTSQVLSGVRPPHVRRLRMQLRNARSQLMLHKEIEKSEESSSTQASKQANCSPSDSEFSKNGEDLDWFAERIVLTCNKAGSSGVSIPEGKKIVANKQFQKEEQKIFVNRFRKILYTEDEIDASDLSMPPSRTNPHPFDPSLNPGIMPPTHSRSLAQYANHLPLLQNLVDIGVDLFTIEKTTAIGRQLVKLDWNKAVLPKLCWLIKLGVPITELGRYLTRNPFFLIQDLNDMKARVNYLYSKKFTKEQVAKIVITFRYWLNMDVRTIDARLGWIQKSFKLSGNEVRSVIVMEPRFFMFGVAPLKRLAALLSEECSFTGPEIKNMVIKEPRLFMHEVSQIAASYLYLHFTMGLSNSQISEYPLALRCPVASLRKRHEFLAKLHRDNYTPGSPNYVPLDVFLHPSDKYFAVNVAKSFLVSFNAFLKKY